MNMKMIFGISVILLTIVIISNFNTVYAQPLQEINVDVLEFDGTFVTVEIVWNGNDASYYEAGCVSCMPNLSYTTTENSIILSNVTPLADGKVLLYILAYDDTDEIISVRQVIVQL